MHVDHFGNAINLGDTLVYPIRHGGKLLLGSLCVHEILPDKISGPNLRGRRTTIRNFDRVAIVRGLDEPKRPRRIN